MPKNTQKARKLGLCFSRDVMCCCAIPVHNLAPSTPQALIFQQQNIVFLGDSITESAVNSKNQVISVGGKEVYPKYDGFIYLLEEKLNEDVELIGKGIGGDKVSDLLTRYNRDVIKFNPDIVFIYIGINDVWHKYDFGTGTDIDLYEKGLRQIISDIKNQGSKIVLCTPTLIGENTGEFTLGNQFKDVETMGDKALIKYTLKYDNVSIKDFLVSEIEISNSIGKVDSELKKAITVAYNNIHKFHSAQKSKNIIIQIIQTYVFQVSVKDA